MRAVYGAEVFAIAGPLKRLANKIYGLTDWQMTDPRAKEKPDPRTGRSPRDILQKLGRDLQDDFGEAVHLLACLDRINKSKAPLTVIEDIRYPMEAQRIYNLGGYVIRLRCTDAPPTANPDHPTERGPEEILPGFIAGEVLWTRADNPPLIPELRRLIASPAFELVRPRLVHLGDDLPPRGLAPTM